MREEVKHFTATAMIRNEHGEFLLHEHQKLGFWLPPGGHIEANEEPQHAVFREVLEETGLECQVVSCGFPFVSQVQDSSHTQVLPLPIAILKEFIADKKKGNHWHIDMIYLCELLPSSQSPLPHLNGCHLTNSPNSIFQPMWLSWRKWSMNIIDCRVNNYHECECECGVSLY
ncbi:NUDIX hydrolase [Providencia rettgeri]